MLQWLLNNRVLSIVVVVVIGCVLFFARSSFTRKRVQIIKSAEWMTRIDLVHLRLRINGNIVFDQKIDGLGGPERVIGDFSVRQKEFKLEVQLLDWGDGVEKVFSIDLDKGSCVELGWENTGLVATALYIRQRACGH